MMRVRSHIAVLPLTFAMSAPALATLDDTPFTDNAPYIATCETVEICRTNSGCAAFPALGELLLRIEGPLGQLGPSEDLLEPLDVIQALDATPIDPEQAGLRILVEEPAEDALTRRFAFFDRSRAGPAGQYFILHCTELSQ